VAHKALHYLSPEDFEKLISVITEEQFKDIVLFAVCTGCRRGGNNESDLGEGKPYDESSLPYKVIRTFK